ncbi:MAG: biotin/lipoate A/B protein ligase family protein [Candidatus Marinarcus sp.]|uniref:lipoate--protein ligase family protein n=1 Tax=Candidatus Marinarcus sp. TaxID=3100987 RepID=UPI003B00AB78
MDNQTVFRVLHSYNESALVNMATDKALASSFKNGDKPILRFYSWEKSYTVGISQKPESYENFYKQYNGNCAKRVSGGGVLFHGHDISYSLVLPTTFLGELNVKQSYEKICSFLLRFYNNLNLKANYAKDIDTIQLSKSDFCQVGYEAYDIIINGIKMGGNAQKRSKNMIFQHGSIPLFRVDNTIELGHSLEEIGVQLSYGEAIEKLTTAFKETFGVQLEDSILNDTERDCLQQLLKDTNDSTKQ